jgi:hypothetical protein
MPKSHRYRGGATFGDAVQHQAGIKESHQQVGQFQVVGADPGTDPRSDQEAVVE